MTVILVGFSDDIDKLSKLISSEDISSKTDVAFDD